VTRILTPGAYGRDWPERGRSHLGEAALMLAILWPAGPPPAIHGSAVDQVNLSRGSQASRESRHFWHLRHIRHEQHEQHLRRLRRLRTGRAALIAGTALAVVAAGTALAADQDAGGARTRFKPTGSTVRKR